MKTNLTMIVRWGTVYAAVALVAANALADSAPAVRVEAIALTVSDVERSSSFFEDVLNFKKESDVEISGEAYEHLFGVFGLRVRVAAMRLGEERIELMQFLAPRGQAIPGDSRANDRWFQHIAIVVSDMDRAYAQLRKHHVEHASSGPQTLPAWNPSAAGIRAFYFRDPDGHFLEIIWFPEGKGDPRWQTAGNDGAVRRRDEVGDGNDQGGGESLFLGIDHTAIVVANTDASLKIYRDLLGMRIVGESENYGTEQEHLNNVFGARLRITTLRAASGPGIELLEYLAPRNGRDAPADTRVNDLWHWHVRIVPENSKAIDDIARSATAQGGLAVSPAAMQVPGELGFRRGVLVRDADGHGLLAVE